jgi:hypothetical protein
MVSPCVCIYYYLHPFEIYLLSFHLTIIILYQRPIFIDVVVSIVIVPRHQAPYLFTCRFRAVHQTRSRPEQEF